MTTDDTALVETIARIIEPSAWRQFDNAMRPFLENRGANQAENFWYQITWRRGIRTPEQCRDWFLNIECDPSLHNESVFAARASIEKASAIVAAIASRELALMEAKALMDLKDAFSELVNQWRDPFETEDEDPNKAWEKCVSDSMREVGNKLAALTSRDAR